MPLSLEATQSTARAISAAPAFAKSRAMAAPTP